jgi:hypothetical protein
LDTNCQYYNESATVPFFQKISRTKQSLTLRGKKGKERIFDYKWLLSIQRFYGSTVVCFVSPVDNLGKLMLKSSFVGLLNMNFIEDPGISDFPNAFVLQYYIRMVPSCKNYKVPVSVALHSAAAIIFSARPFPCSWSQWTWTRGWQQLLPAARR